MMCYTMKFDNKLLVTLTSLGTCAATGFYIMFDLQKVIMPEFDQTNEFILASICLYLDIGRLFYYTTSTTA